MFSEISGTWDKMRDIIPLLSEMGYIDMHLYYEDAGIWVLEFHNPEHDNLLFELPKEE